MVSSSSALRVNGRSLNKPAAHGAISAHVAVRYLRSPKRFLTSAGTRSSCLGEGDRQNFSQVTRGRLFSHLDRVNRQGNPQLTEQRSHACKNSKCARKLGVLSGGVGKPRVEIFDFCIQQIQQCSLPDAESFRIDSRVAALESPCWRSQSLAC